MSDNKDLVVYEEKDRLHSIENVIDQVRLVHEALKKVMQENVHYGIIPGCGKKPTLLRPGAQKLMVLFRLHNQEPNIQIKDLGNGHREYIITQKLTTNDGLVVSCGVGSASTLESKWRYRKDYQTGERIENPDIADQYNTVLKIAKKRSLVDGVIEATACGDIFTQDIEDMERPLQQQQTAVKQTPTQQAEPKKWTIDKTVYKFRYHLPWKKNDANGNDIMEKLRAEIKAKKLGVFDGDDKHFYMKERMPQLEQWYRPLEPTAEELEASKEPRETVDDIFG